MRGPPPGRGRTTAVARGTSVGANPASPAAVVLGDAAAAWLERRRLPARLCGADGTVRALAGWPAEHAAHPGGRPVEDAA